MNFVDSDLEEGEILDDSPSPYICDKKLKELPQCYVVHEKNSPIHRHKKDCKYAIRYHAKKLAKMKKTPKSKDCYKRHHKSTCPRDKSHKLFEKSTLYDEKNFSKNGHTFSQHSLIAEMKGSFKDVFIKKQNTRHIPKSDKNISETENIKTGDFTVSEIDIKNSESLPENTTTLSDSKCHNQSPLNCTNDLVNLFDLNTNNDIKVSCNTSDSSSKIKNEESEDEEELRRIALATCAKRKVLKESENLIQNVDSNHIVPVPKSPENNVQLSHQETVIPASDNYEVVDMEVDEDIEASLEILDNSRKEQSSELIENLFVIDTKPSEDFKENKEENTLPELKTANNSSDDDFAADILRAELIRSLYHKKRSQDECIENQKSTVDIPHKQVPILPKKKHSGNFKKSNVNFYHKHLRPGKRILRKTKINKIENLYCTTNKSLPRVQVKPSAAIQVNKSSERLVIALNEESSEDSVDSESENPVASIEALISDCRQKSESSEKTKGDVVTSVPKAVSCLSKAQQEEYTSLMKILAKKEKLQESSEVFQHKNGSVHSPLDDLKLLEGKLIGFKETLKKKKEMLEFLLKDINSKKLLYMKSKLTVQHLKEQYIAAEKIKKANLSAWSKSCSDFESLKVTVLKLENKIIELKDLCSKVGASIQGQTYN